MNAQHTPGPAAEAIANADAHLNDAALKPYTQLAEEHAELLEALQELVTLVDDIRSGDYTPDSFTTQPARAAIAKATGSAA